MRSLTPTGPARSPVRTAGGARSAMRSADGVTDANTKSEKQRKEGKKMVNGITLRMLTDDVKAQYDILVNTGFTDLTMARKIAKMALRGMVMAKDTNTDAVANDGMANEIDGVVNSMQDAQNPEIMHLAFETIGIYCPEA